MPSVLKLKKQKTEPAKFLRFAPKAAAIAPVAAHSPAVVGIGNAMSGLVGKAVFFAHKGERVAGKAVRIDGDSLVINLAVPGRDGILLVSDSELTVKANDMEVTKALMQQKLMKRFEGGAALALPADRKAIPLFDQDEKTIKDYRDVYVEGFASTFVSTTPRDRGGDYIIPGAFDHTLTEFRKNPVILCDHDNEVAKLAGSWEKVGITQMGLAVRGQITNAPGMRDVRFKIVEKHLKGVSIGGIWYYIDDGRGIEQADLFEISLVPVPMNPDALVYTRSLNVEDCTKAFAKFWRSNSSLNSA